jgi:hypothetical protein
MRLTLSLLLLPALVFLARPVSAQNEDADSGPGTFAQPGIVNPNWSIDLELDTPNAIYVDPENAPGRWYWYAAYKVTNNTGDDRLFIPEVVIIDNDGRIVQANRRIPPAVFPVIAERLGNPLLESPNNVVGRLLQGEDFAKESVVIWPAAPRDVDEFTLFFGGVDGETQPLVSPSSGEVVMQEAVDPITGKTVTDEDGEPVMRPVTVRRTRAYTFATPGTLNRFANLRQQPVRRVEEFVVMR